MQQKLYFRQLLAGHDLAQSNPSAQAMENFIYLIGDREKGICVVVDPAWDIRGIIAIAAADNMKIVAALVTHYHPDHVGGHIFGMNIEGLKELMTLNPCPVHAHKLEKDGLIKTTNLSTQDIVAHESGDKVKVGDIDIELLHTPGHTPGSLCFRLKNVLVSGDTLFLHGCGRVDLPGGDVAEMHKTIQERFKSIDNNTIIYPGHAYGGQHDSMGNVRKHNPVFGYVEFKAFRKLFGF